MGTVNDLLKVAAGELGYHAPDDPEPGSKYGRWLAAKWDQDWLAGPSTEIWWCCMFVSWCLDQADVYVPGFPTYNTDRAYNGSDDGSAGAKSREVSKYDAQPGDILIFDWNMSSLATDHIGFCEANLGGGVLQTIEGNTGGSQYSSNAVQRRTRSLDNIRYVIRPEFKAKEPDKPKYPNGWIHQGDGWWYNQDGWYPRSQWLKIDGNWYHFNPDGWMDTNFFYDSNWQGWFYLNGDVNAPDYGAMKHLKMHSNEDGLLIVDEMN